MKTTFDILLLSEDWNNQDFESIDKIQKAFNNNGLEVMKELIYHILSQDFDSNFH